MGRLLPTILLAGLSLSVAAASPAPPGKAHRHASAKSGARPRSDTPARSGAPARRHRTAGRSHLGANSGYRHAGHATHPPAFRSEPAVLHSHSASVNQRAANDTAEGA